MSKVAKSSQSSIAFQFSLHCFVIQQSFQLICYLMQQELQKQWKPWWIIQKEIGSALLMCFALLWFQSMIFFVFYMNSFQLIFTICWIFREIRIVTVDLNLKDLQIFLSIFAVKKNFFRLLIMNFFYQNDSHAYTCLLYYFSRLF